MNQSNMQANTPQVGPDPLSAIGAYLAEMRPTAMSIMDVSTASVTPEEAWNEIEAAVVQALQAMVNAPEGTPFSEHVKALDAKTRFGAMVCCDALHWAQQQAA